MSTEQKIILHNKEFELYLERNEIKKAIKEMAALVNEAYNGKEVLVVGVLDGAFMVLSDLLKNLDLRISLELVKLKSYDGEHSTGKIHKLIGLTSSLQDQHVLIVEDIIDTGLTLEYLLEIIREQNPKSVKIATLLLKEPVFKGKFPIDYVGFSIPEKFVVGYGMDYNGQGRQLKHIYAAKD